MVAYTNRLPAGFAGTVSRSDSLTVEQQVVDPNAPVKVYGSAVKIVSGKVQPIGTGDTAASVYGWAIRAFPVQSVSNGLGAAAPAVTGILDILKRGYMSVTLKAGTAAKNGPVYVRVVDGSGRVTGDIEAAADGTNTIAISGAYFTGPADANGIVEMAFNI